MFLKFKLKFHKIHGKTPILYQGLFFSKPAGPRHATLLKKQTPTQVFPLNFGKFLRIPFWKATVSQNMKAFKLQIKFRETKEWLNPYYD